MADFVAVIRRTVDGLSDNVPEMRAKVYEKARGAVRRQLESMKPRPSDEMIERQMVKLEAAIMEVESDHAEALPALEEELAAAPPEIAAEPVEAAEEPAVAEEAPPAVAEAHPAVETDAEDSHGDVVEEPSHQPVEAHVDAVAPIDETVESPGYEETAAPEPAPVAAEAGETYGEQGEPAPAAEPVSQAELAETGETVEVPAEDEPLQHELPQHQLPLDELPQPELRQDEPPHELRQDELPQDELPQAASEPPYAVAAQTSSQDDAHVSSLLEDEFSAPATVKDKPMPSASSEWELPEWNDPVPVVAHSQSVWTEAAGESAITDEIPDLTDYERAEPAASPHAASSGKEQETAEPSHSWAWDDSDPFTQKSATGADSTEPAISDWSWPVEKQAPADEQKPAGDAWNDVDDLLHYNAAPAATGAAAAFQQNREAAGVGEDLAVASRPVSYRAEPKRSSINLKVIAIVAAILIILGGATYAYWRNQEAVNAWVTATIDSLTAQIPAQKTPDATGSQATKNVATPEASKQAETPPSTEVASVEGSSTKFTQRLQADGTEVDQGPAPVPGGEAASEEGKSVAAQTEAGAPQDVAQATPGGQADNAQPAQAVPEQQNAVNPATQQIPAGAQKMFLYEERLGQSAPTAIEGNVAWSVKEESPGGDAKPEPVVQAQINVPERGLTALMTIKRNADTSLPASHVIEFVFSLPENFEGGSIESVQRVAMKRNEQDRGDPLIAVPAKITEDFHMIALNDFPEAVATNTELLRSRSWIDIPLTYRNGRRALLTLEKGPAGTEAFAKAMQAWSLAAKPNPAGQ
ncbi:hypothetical protein [Rhizobium giardinii]|uniref:Uncharacterized protein n=1 Tax=Rhizobium giardinii TaxID=56731 RepID=A0A7W8U9K1_9HYPH|nr:hypothetical protein [Rhizobium giardinii]MBB5535258.1 hypothetical protein [Rhizobium giardinii]